MTLRVAGARRSRRADAAATCDHRHVVGLVPFPPDRRCSRPRRRGAQYAGWVELLAAAKRMLAQIRKGLDDRDSRRPEFPIRT